MSHYATNWAIRQRGLKPATKLVLWHLCDRHNPDEGCFPSQDRLADDCEMSRSSLNEHLKTLEGKGLIRREQRLDPKTKRQQSTRYIFAFEAEFRSDSPAEESQDVVEPCRENGHGAVSGNQQEPCPENGQSRVRNLDTNPVREPVREPSERASAREGGDFDILWSGWPDAHLPDNRQAAAAIFSKLRPDDQRKAIDLAKTYHRFCAIRKKRALMIPYLRRRHFIELYDAPPLDSDGDFVITPGRREWSEWLGAIRREHGEGAVQSTIRIGKIIRKTRWPEPAKTQQAA